MNIRTDSTEYVQATLITDHDITGDTIEVALPVTGVAPSTWFPATVTSVTKTGAAPDKWTATYRILVGPSGGAVALTAGTYDWVVRLTDTPEIPVRKAGTVIATDV